MIAPSHHERRWSKSATTPNGSNVLKGCPSMSMNWNFCGRDKKSSGRFQMAICHSSRLRSLGKFGCMAVRLPE